MRRAVDGRRAPALLLAAGAPLLLLGGAWLLLDEHEGKAVAALAAGLGWALICCSQAVRMSAGRRSAE